MKKRFILLAIAVMGLSLFCYGCGPDIEEVEVQAQELLEDKEYFARNLTLIHEKGNHYSGSVEIYRNSVWVTKNIDVTCDGRTISIEWND